MKNTRECIKVSPVQLCSFPERKPRVPSSFLSTIISLINSWWAVLKAQIFRALQQYHSRVFSCTCKCILSADFQNTYIHIQRTIPGYLPTEQDCQLTVYGGSRPHNTLCTGVFRRCKLLLVLANLKWVKTLNQQGNTPLEGTVIFGRLYLLRNVRQS